MSIIGFFCFVFMCVCFAFKSIAELLCPNGCQLPELSDHPKKWEQSHPHTPRGTVLSQLPLLHPGQLTSR